MRTAFFSALMIILSPSAWACSVCFKDPDSPLTKGLEMGVLVLLGFVAFVLVMFAVFFLNIRHRIGKNIKV